MNRVLIMLVSAALAACGQSQVAADKPVADVAKQTPAEIDALAIVLDAQTDEMKARYPYRHPKETLEFMGIEPGMTVVEGLPAGLDVEREALAAELARRRSGHGRGRRMRLEQDTLEILGGVRFGKTLGSPVAVVIRNTEWPKWQEEMSPDAGAARRTLTTPRPGHADLAGMQKYDTHDARDILERASARETAARTVVGYLAKALLRTVGVEIVSHVVAIGDVASSASALPSPDDAESIDASPVRAYDKDAEAAMIAGFVTLGVPRVDAVTAVFLFRGLHYSLVFGCGIPSIVTLEWQRRRRRAAERQR